LRWSPTVSPDGKWIAFAQQTGERAELFRVPIGGGSQSQITFGANVVPRGSVAWSPDGQSLAYGSIRGGRSQVWIATLENGQTRPIRQSYLSAFRANVAWAPARQITYLNTGQTAIQLADPITGSVREIVPSPSLGFGILQNPKNSPDGRHVAAAWNRGAGDFGVWVFDVADSVPPRKIADGWLWPAAWSPDGRYVYASLYNVPTLYRIDTKEPKPPLPVISPLSAWRRVDQNTPAREMECTLAGKLRPDAFICTVFDFVSDIWIIDNFEALKN